MTNDKKKAQPIESVTSEQIRVQPYDISAETFKITKKINEHTKVTLYGWIKYGNLEMTNNRRQKGTLSTDEHNTFEKFLEEIKSNEKIKIRIGNIETFYGIVTNFEIELKGGRHYAKIEALSYTYLLDIEKKPRTFQDSEKKYIDLIKEITKKYNGQVLFAQKDPKRLGKFKMQYRETDWQFIKRMTSCCNNVLIPKTDVGEVAFYFGIPGNGAKSIKLNKPNYSAKKNLKDYGKDKELYKKNHITLLESHYTFYNINTRQNADVGDKVDLDVDEKKLKGLIIREINTKLENGLLKHKYTLCPRDGLAQVPTFNNEIIGASLNGEVIDIDKDKVQIRFNFDKEDFDKNKDKKKNKVKDKEKNKNSSKKYHWFPYSTIYALKDNAGWYCMPEIGDEVRVYFPSKEENHGIVISSAKKDTIEKPIHINTKDGNRVTHPEVKSFQTAYGKRIVFAPEQILIVGDDTVIQMHDDDGIRILADKKIEFNAEENILLDAKKIIGDAEKISLYCKKNIIEVDKNKIQLQGEKILLN